MHTPIHLHHVSFSIPAKDCFEDFSSTIYPGSRIAIIGRNGSGKSSLLNILRGAILPSSGEIKMPKGVCLGYVEQTIQDFDNLSGGQRLNRRLSEQLAQNPDLLLLDEPTNHLDKGNRKSLMRMLRRFQGTLIIVSHDTELLRHCVDTLWHIDNGRIIDFNGSYDDYMCDIKRKREMTERELAALKQDKSKVHQALMKEQNRAAKSKAKGQKNINQKKWPTVVSQSKEMNAEQTSGKKKSEIDKRNKQLTEQLSNLRLPEIILPTFSIKPESICSATLLSISGGSVGYSYDQSILEDVSLVLGGKERIAINGANASGKSTFIKAILEKDEVYRRGEWFVPRFDHIGYLDQHYHNLSSHLSVFKHIKDLRPDWTDKEVRRHLGDFLFKKNEEVMQIVTDLSGGEKALLSLSMIAAKTPRLLILDEITNNIDLETRHHVVQVLKEYPGAMVIISHDEDFLKAINIDHTYTIVNGKFSAGVV